MNPILAFLAGAGLGLVAIIVIMAALLALLYIAARIEDRYNNGWGFAFVFVTVVSLFCGFAGMGVWS